MHGRMARYLIPDERWAIIEQLLSPRPARRRGGRPRLGDRRVLTGIVLVLKTGTPWDYLSQEMGCGSGMTGWRRLRDWQAAGAWDRLYRVLLDRLGQADLVDMDRAAADSMAVPALWGGQHRPEPDGSRQTGHEAPCCGRRQRYPARGETLRCECPRL